MSKYEHSSRFTIGCRLINASSTNSASSPGKHFIPPNLPYLSELIAHYLPSRSLRSSNTNLLAGSHGITTSQATFRHGPFPFQHHLPGKLYLPEHIRRIDEVVSLQTPTKISSIPLCLFRLGTLCQRLVSDSFYDFWLFINMCMYVGYMYVHRAYCRSWALQSIAVLPLDCRRDRVCNCCKWLSQRTR